ncbi:hypothetical protein IV203_014666 [Nitzschia inconspicua]|uniref:Uncharacterized protein n=1 Tax=Nitzschia inconspicua TaxID=303405 RepID=A0A9K3PUX5_9STRA|nr:hypothetical protein IV203_014666 [Nitzschia inconspicua]
MRYKGYRRQQGAPVGGIAAGTDVVVAIIILIINLKLKRQKQQCAHLFSEERRQSLKGETQQRLTLPPYEARKTNGDVSQLHQCTKVPSQRCLHLTIIELLEDLFNFKQEPGVSLHDYYEEFCLKLDIVERYTGQYAVGKCHALIEEEGGDEKKARDKSAGILLLRGADHRIFEGCWNDLENLLSHGIDQYPKNISSVFRILGCSKPPWSPPQPKPTQATVQGLSFTRASPDSIPGCEGILKNNILCFKCQHKGPYANKCPSTG